MLVAAARDDRQGEELLTAYIDLQATNPYDVYRERSLWAVLGAVACLPHPEQALHHLIRLAEGAFAPSPVRFAEALPVSLLARRVLAGGSSADLLNAGEWAVQEADELSAVRTSDRWSHHRRRLAAHAEAAALLGDRAAAESLLDRAIGLPIGFAGYQAPANVTLAEANIIARPDQPDAVGAALRAALVAAHNVQDPSFCARTTAGVDAVPGGGCTDRAISERSPTGSSHDPMRPSSCPAMLSVRSSGSVIGPTTCR